MGSYYNRTRGPVTVSLRDGGSAVVTPKGVLEVSPEQDGSPSLHAMVRRGYLVRVPGAPPRPTPESSPTLLPSPREVPADLDAPSMQWTKSRLAEYAESLGIEIPSGWTKAEILEAITVVGRD